MSTMGQRGQTHMEKFKNLPDPRDSPFWIPIEERGMKKKPRPLRRPKPKGKGH